MAYGVWPNKNLGSKFAKIIPSGNQTRIYYLKKHETEILRKILIEIRRHIRVIASILNQVKAIKFSLKMNTYLEVLTKNYNRKSEVHSICELLSSLLVVVLSTFERTQNRQRSDIKRTADYPYAAFEGEHLRAQTESVTASAIRLYV